jgi:hypothetical protein
MRRRSAVGLFLYAARSMVNDYPWQTLIGVGTLMALVLLVGVIWLWP